MFPIQMGTLNTDLCLKTKSIYLLEGFGVMDSTYCTNCGGKLSPADRFCPHCGSKVNHQPSTVPNSEPKIGPPNVGEGYESSSPVNDSPPKPPAFSPPASGDPQISPSANPMLYQTSFPAQQLPTRNANFVSFQSLPRMLKIAMVIQYIMIIIVFVGLILLVYTIATIFSLFSGDDIPPGLFVIFAFLAVMGLLVAYLTRQIQYRSAGARILIAFYHGLVVSFTLLFIISSASFDPMGILFLVTSSFILYTFVVDKETSQFFNGFGPPYHSS
ncbi:MAG: hypothetical protein D6732_23950 [Methanobacteriota archaeon]|nr:MAG: hypothetical protein D6732_23950 [Euryarchaeota archaeon]